MNFQVKTPFAFLGFFMGFVIAALATAPGASARNTRITTLGSPVFHTNIKQLRERRALRHKKYFRRKRGLRSRVRCKGLSIFFNKRAVSLGPPTRCNFSWHEANGYGYRKVKCKRGYRPRFRADRPWAYRAFKRTANWEQSRAWQGRIKPHNLYKSQIPTTDPVFKFKRNSELYLDHPVRYEQSLQFGQKIFFPRPAWE